MWAHESPGRGHAKTAIPLLRELHCWVAGGGRTGVGCGLKHEYGFADVNKLLQLTGFDEPFLGGVGADGWTKGSKGKVGACIFLQSVDCSSTS